MSEWEDVPQTVAYRPDNQGAGWEDVPAASYSPGLTGAKEMAEDAMTRIAASATFGLAPKASALIGSLTGKGDYDEILKRRRAEVEEAGKRLGWGGALASDLAGGMGATSALSRGGLTLAGRLPATAGVIPKVAAGALEGAGYGAAYGAGNTDTGKLADYLTNAGEGAVFGGLVGGGVPLAAKVVGTPLKYVASALSGVSPESVALANRAGQMGGTSFRGQQTGKAEMTEPVEMTQRALAALRAERSAAYNAEMAAVKQNQTPLSYRPVLDALNDAQKKIVYGGLPKSKEALATLQEIGTLVQQRVAMPGQQGAMHRTVEGFDQMKQAIGEVRAATKPGTLSRTVADDIYNATKATIVKQEPKYAKAMEGYEKATEQLRELTQTFSTGEKVSKDTTLRKLQSILRNDVSTNYGRRAKLGDVLAKYEPDLPFALAGQQMRPILPRGIGRAVSPVALGAAAMANPAMLALAPLASPRAVGAVAYASGAMGPIVRNASRPIPGLLTEDQRRGLLGQ